MLLRLQKYTIHLAYLPGKEIFLADTSIRAYLRNNDQTGVLNEETIHLARFLPVIEDTLQLTVQDGILFKGERILIPETMKMDMLQRIHSSHIGIEGSLRRAR